MRPLLQIWDLEQLEKSKKSIHTADLFTAFKNVEHSFLNAVLFDTSNKKSNRIVYIDRPNKKVIQIYFNIKKDV